MAKTKDTGIETSIYVIRGQRVMLDFDLARLYGVETKYLKKAVRRNIERFSDDFMFELSSWRFQFGTSRFEKKGFRICPFAFRGDGVAMLSASCLRRHTIHPVYKKKPRFLGASF